MSENEKKQSSADKPTPAKTPRKIQWLNEGGRQQSEDSIVNRPSLDPAGLDPHGFAELTDALEKHRRAMTPIAAPSPLSKVHYYPPLPSIKKPAKDGDVREESSSDSSGNRSGSEGDSDTDNDSESPEVTPPLTTIPTPAEPVRRSIPNVPIPEEEDAGLPTAEDIKQLAERQAERIVKTHTRRLSKGHPILPQPALAAQGKSRAREKRRDIDERAIGNGDKSDDLELRDLESKGVEEEAEGDGKGILSTLLKLYEPPGSGYASSYVSSAASSGRSSPTSIWSRDDQEPSARSADKTAHGRFDDKSRKRSRVPRPRATIPSLGLVPRPTQARTGAGVFGPLIAATGSLTGVAAPHHGGLQPNLERPGYKLSRYTADDVQLPKAPPPTAITATHSDPSDDRRLSTSTDRTVISSRPPSPISGASSINEDAGYRRGMFRRPNLSMESLRSVTSGRWSGNRTPSIMSNASDREDHSSAYQRKNRAKRRKRKKDEVFITKHVAQIIQREEFLLKLTRAMMMFGGPSHRLQLQIQSAARVLGISLSFLYLPDVALVSFEDAGTGTSHIKIIRQSSQLDIGKLTEAFKLYWRVIHDKLSVSDASVDLDRLMRRKPIYNWWQRIIIGGLCSSLICTISFGGSFLDAVISFPLGAFLFAVQILSVRNVLYSHVFEITITMFCSFIAAALAASRKFCYSAVASSSVVSILPGFLVLTASLELVSRNVAAGAIRICYSMIYALFLGFGFTMGAQIFQIVTGNRVFGMEDYVCSASHNPNGPWYQRTPNRLWVILTVPLFSLFLSFKNGAPWNSRELVVLVVISCAGWVTTYFTGLKFPDQNDIVASVGAFAVGIIANLYARLFSGNAFVVMITGILFQVPSGLGVGGLLSYASEQAAGSGMSYISGFRSALKLVSVAIGLAIGLSLALVVMHPFESRKRAGGIFSL